jgi:hypothetical protein
MTRGRYIGWAVALTLLGCGGEDDKTAPEPSEEPLPGTFVETDAQREGDAAAGYHALVHEGYVGCGVPFNIYNTVFGPAPANMRLPGREGKNEDMAYTYNVYTADSGVDIVMPNCLGCHAQVFQGEVIVGLGDTVSDFTINTAGQVELAKALATDPDELAEIEKFAERTSTLAPYIQTLTVGVNPAENITAVLIAHRDQKTLAWSDEPLLPLPPEYVVPVDVPPWWRMKKKNSMFYVSSGRGDHARIMTTASTLCVDDVATAAEIDSYFPDVRAFINSIEAPPYPFEIDAALAEQGQQVFDKVCSQCHGTYGEIETYPNLLIHVDDVGTDDTLARASTHLADEYVDWYNGSFYGELSQIEPHEGYVAPPLDGIWITGPFLHNGSVPTIAALLDSSIRPKYWTRSYDSNDYDTLALGYPYTELPAGQADEADYQKRKLIYDTTYLGYSNAGHTYGDPLTPEQRAAVIEYLKTL